MPRPKKCRRVGFIPEIEYFFPKRCGQFELQEVTLSIEELEAIRLSDLHGLEQTESAKQMAVSRGTFQRILNSAREKVADALTAGKAIRIEGGNYSRNLCRFICPNCNKTLQDSYENFLEGKINCPQCDNKELVCEKHNDFCKRYCRRFRGRCDY